MTRTFQSLELVVLIFLFLPLDSHTSQVSPPQNVSLRWLSDFNPQLSWEPPLHSAGQCTYIVETSTTNKEEDKETIPRTELSWSDYIVMEGRTIYLSVRAFCNGVHSERVHSNIIFPELVRNLSCYIHSSKLTRCSWSPVSNAADVGFFYRLRAQDLSISHNTNSYAPLRACPAYNDGRTGCDLQADIIHDIHILFNGTVNNEVVRNTFKISLRENVRPLPLKWTVIKAGDKFNISWIPPDFGEPSSWNFKIRQTACNKETFEDKESATSTQLKVVPHCKNCVAIQVQWKQRESEWSENKCFGSEPNALVYAAIIIPLVFAVLAVLTLVCCRKNRDIIFPRVPVPRDFLSDISDNNNKITVRNLCIPAEEEDCKITLVIDPLNNKLIS